MEQRDNPVGPNALRPTAEIDRAIGRQLRLRRELQGVSAAQCSEMTGLLPAQLQSYEAGTERIPAGRLAEFARILEAPVSYFFDPVGSGVMKEWMDNVITFPVDSIRPPQESTLAEQELIRLFRAIKAPQDRELLVQMAERLAGD